MTHDPNVVVNHKQTIPTHIRTEYSACMRMHVKGYARTCNVRMNVTACAMSPRAESESREPMVYAREIHTNAHTSRADRGGK